MSQSRAGRPRPFVIWTLQRTGGTNLAVRLAEVVGLPVQHEPFNRGRKYGAITARWNESRDREALDAALREVVAHVEVIKHCVETVPWEVTESLIRATTAADRRHLFLYRRRSLDRLLSLHFARQTGIWGPDMKKMKQIAPEADESKGPGSVPAGILEKPLPVEALVAHQRRCTALLAHAWSLLERLGATPVAMAYEDLYRANEPHGPQKALAPVIDALDLPIGEAGLDAFAATLTGGGLQGTSALYVSLPGYHRLSKRCADMPEPDPSVRKVTLNKLGSLPAFIEHFAVDSLPGSASSSVPFEVGGVLALGADAPTDAKLVLVAQTGDRSPVTWGIASPRIARLYPQAGNSARSRWKGQLRMRCGERVMLLLCVGAHDIDVAEIRLGDDKPSRLDDPL